MRIALVDDSEIERGILLSLITDYGCEKQILFESDCFDWVLSIVMRKIFQKNFLSVTCKLLLECI